MFITSIFYSTCLWNLNLIAFNFNHCIAVYSLSDIFQILASTNVFALRILVNTYKRVSMVYVYPELLGHRESVFLSLWDVLFLSKGDCYSWSCQQCGRQCGLKIALKIERYGPAVPILGIQVWELLFIHILPNKEQVLSIQLILPPLPHWDSEFLIPSKYMTESRDYSVGILPSPLQGWECCVLHLPLLQSLHLGNRRFKS